MSKNELFCEIVAAVSKYPGISAKELVRVLNAQRGTHDLRKGTINPILYRRTDLFRYEGQHPPCWYVRQPRIEQPADKPRRHPAPPIVSPPPVSTRTRRGDQRRPAAPKPVVLPKYDVLSKGLYTWQQEAIEAWKKAGCRGVVEAVTGTGKTFVAISLINEYLKKQKRCLVVVPSQILMRQWKNEIELEFGLTVTSLLGGGYGKNLDPRQCITIGVVNSVAAMQQSGELDCEFGLLVADECHRFGSPQFRYALLDSIDHRLGLTATFERADNALEEILLPYFSPEGKTKTKNEISGVCFQYDFSKATEDKVIARYVLSSVSIDLTDEEREQYENLGSTMAKARRRLQIDHRYPTDFKAFLRKSQRPGKLREEGILCQQFFKALRGRRKLLSESTEKDKVVEKLGGLIEASSGALIYTETIESAERLASLFTESAVAAEAYHSKLSKQDREKTFDRFCEHDTDCLVAVHALDEGVNVPKANLAVIVSGSQQRRQMIQRMGRVLRKKFNDSGAVFIHIYASNTAEDPYTQEGDEGYLSVLREHAKSHRKFVGASLEECDILDWVEEEGILENSKKGEA